MSTSVPGTLFFYGSLSGSLLVSTQVSVPDVSCQLSCADLIIDWFISRSKYSYVSFWNRVRKASASDSYGGSVRPRSGTSVTFEGLDVFLETMAPIER